MALVVHSLASGSSGNCILVKDGETAVLIDAGIGIRRLSAALTAAEVNPADLSAILITHEHTDHVSGADRMARRYGVPIVANAPTLARQTRISMACASFQNQQQSGNGPRGGSIRAVELSRNDHGHPRDAPSLWWRQASRPFQISLFR